MKVDDKLQYGQKNAQGELRFGVYHDKERKPFQASHTGETTSQHKLTYDHSIAL